MKHDLVSTSVNRFGCITNRCDRKGRSWKSKRDGKKQEVADKEEEKKGRGKREKGEKEGGERETEKEKEMTVVALPSMIDCDRKWWAVCRK